MDRLTDEEIAALKKLLPIADQIAEQAKFSAARQLVFGKYRSGMIWFASLITAFVYLNDSLAEALVKLLGGK